MNYRHLPDWVSQNRLFRFFFLLRKLFLIKSSRSHWAQFGEDISVTRFFGKKVKEGFFVDVGCFHPKKYSNTWQLYKRGWRGINIDIDSIKIAGFNLLRRQDVNVCKAVSNKEGIMDYYSSGFYSLENSLSEDFVDGNPAYQKKTVKCATLTSIIDSSRFKDRKIDFLTVDVEGFDLQVLESLDFDRYSPRLIAVESHEKTLRAVKETGLYQFLDRRGYDLIGWCGLTLLMSRQGPESDDSTEDR